MKKTFEDEIFVYKLGKNVFLVNSDIVGLITGICIRDNNITYEISYYNKGEHKKIWLCEFEIDFVNEEKTKIGFRND